VILLLLAPSSARATDLKPEATQGFDQYIRLTEGRMERETAPGEPSSGSTAWRSRDVAMPRRVYNAARIFRNICGQPILLAELRRPAP
jgi:hypothetical protein